MDRSCCSVDSSVSHEYAAAVPCPWHAHRLHRDIGAGARARLTSPRKCSLVPRHSKIDEVLRVTKLRTVFPPSQTEAGAAGYRVLSAHSLPDALILLVATKPAV